MNAWNAQRPDPATGAPRDVADVFFIDHNGQVQHRYIDAGQPKGSEDLGTPPATVVTEIIGGVHTGNPLAYTAVRVLCSDDSVWERALPWAGGSGAWAKVG